MFLARVAAAVAVRVRAKRGRLPDDRAGEFVATQNCSGAWIDDKHFAGPEAFALDDFLAVECCESDFGAEDYETVSGHCVAQRSKTVAIELGADDAAVAEDQRRRAVPGLLFAGLKREKLAQLGGNSGSGFPCGRDHAKHRGAGRVSRAREKFEDVIEAG